MKVMSGLSAQSRFVLATLVALFILPCPTVKSILVWVNNFIIMLLMDKTKQNKKYLYLSGGLEF